MKTNRLITGGLALAIALVAQQATAEPLKVGSTATGVPFTFLDVESNQIQGMMVDLIKAVGKEAGFEPQVEAIDFASLIPALTSGRIDLISAAMLATDTRKEVIDFSDPVFPYGEGIVVGQDFEGPISTDFSELEGKVVGVQQGTVYLENLQKVDGFAELRVYDSLANILAEVDRGRIDAGMGDRPIIAYQLSQGQYSDTKLVEDYESQYTGELAIGVRKEDGELLERVNTAIAKLKEDGTVDELVSKWGLD